MLKFKWNEDKYQFQIAENSEGKWKPLHRNNLGYSQEFIGWGGELQITILLSAMQSGITHIVVVFSSVNSFHVVRSVEIRSRNMKDEAGAVNALIQSCIFSDGHTSEF